MENCQLGYKKIIEIEKPCPLGMAQVLWMKFENKKHKGIGLPEERCKYGVFSNNLNDCHCMWKMIENREEKPMSVKEIARALYLHATDVEAVLEKALRKIRNSDMASEYFEMKMEGIDIYEGLSQYVQDIDFYNDGDLSMGSGVESPAEPSEGGKRARGRPKNGSKPKD